MGTVYGFAGATYRYPNTLASSPEESYVTLPIGRGHCETLVHHEPVTWVHQLGGVPLSFGYLRIGNVGYRIGG